MKATQHQLQESHRRQFDGEDWQAVAQDICDGIPGATEEDFIFLSSSPDPGCDCGFCAATEWRGLNP
ncbi:MAG: hypothetical protein WDO13_07820 [Verrucomicrobiota bacterium]